MSASPNTLVSSPPPNISAPHQSTPPLTAEGVLEWCIYYVEESGHESTFPEEYGLDFSFTDAAIFYPDRIEKEGLKAPSYVGLDLQTSLDGVIYDSRSFDFARNVIDGLKHPAQKELKAEVESLLDTELERYGIDLREDQQDIYWKAGILSRYRQMRMASAKSLPKGRYIKRGKGHEFEVHLEYLVGGHSGSSRHTILYFEYNTSFHFFMKTLQDATQLCTIPPIDFTKPHPAESSEPLPYHPGYPPSVGRFGRNDPIRKLAETADEKGKDPASMNTVEIIHQPPVSDTKPKLRRRSVRGYTLADGPWTYRKFRMNSKYTKSDHDDRVNISNEEDYLNMVGSLRKTNQGYKGADDVKESISIMHSLEYEMRKVWLDFQRENERGDQRTKDMLLNGLKARTAEDIEEDDRGMKNILDQLGIEEFTDDEFEDGIGWMDMWDRKHGSAGSL